MKIYNENNLSEPLTYLNLGIVQAGDKKQFNFIVENDSVAELVELIFKPESSEVKVITAPKKIKSYERASLTLEWAPSVTLKSGLKTKLSIKCYEIYS